jgi:hypothetical protein
MFEARSALDKITPPSFYGNLVRSLRTNRLLRVEWAFLPIALAAMAFSIVSLARARRFEHLLAYAVLLGPFLFIPSVWQDAHFYTRTISSFFPAFFVSVILLVRSVEKMTLWKEPRRSKLALATCVCLGLVLTVGAADRIRRFATYFAKPQKYFNDIAYDHSFEEAATQVAAQVPRNQLLLTSPHLAPFLDHPYTTDYFLSQLCAGRHHPTYFPNADISTRLLCRCRLSDVHVAVLHPVFYENDVLMWNDGTAWLTNIVKTWELIGSEGAFAIYRNPNPSSPSVSPINQSQ